MCYASVIICMAHKDSCGMQKLGYGKREIRRQIKKNRRKKPRQIKRKRDSEREGKLPSTHESGYAEKLNVRFQHSVFTSETASHRCNLGFGLSRLWTNCP